MFTTFNSKSTTIFLDSNSNINYDIEKDTKLNIIVSPSFYWVKKVSLPIKYVKDAKKLLPSLFEEVLPEGNYSYTTYKKENYFYIFAYEDKLILDAISKANIPSTAISNIYFAQSELDSLETAFSINELQSIYTKDDIVVLVPSNLIKESQDLNLSELTLSKHSINLQQYAHIVDNSIFKKVGAAFLILALLFFSEFFILKQKTTLVQTQKAGLISKYKLKQTMFQNKSMLKKYKKIDTKQKNIRKYVLDTLSLKLNPGLSITQMKMVDKKLIVSFYNASLTSISKIKQQLQKNKITFKSSSTGKDFRLEFDL